MKHLIFLIASLLCALSLHSLGEEEKEFVEAHFASGINDIRSLTFSEPMFSEVENAPAPLDIRFEPHVPYYFQWLSPKTAYVFPTEGGKQGTDYKLILPEGLHSLSGKEVKLAQEPISLNPIWPRKKPPINRLQNYPAGLLRVAYKEGGHYSLALSLEKPISNADLAPFLTQLQWVLSRREDKVTNEEIKWHNPARPEQGIEPMQGFKLVWNIEATEAHAEAIEDAEGQASHQYRLIFFDVELPQVKNAAGEFVRPYAGSSIVCQSSSPLEFHGCSFLTPPRPKLEYCFERKYLGKAQAYYPVPADLWLSGEITQSPELCEFTLWKAEGKTRSQILKTTRHALESNDNLTQDEDWDFIPQEMLKHLQPYKTEKAQRLSAITESGIYLVEAKARPSEEWLEVSPMRSEAYPKAQFLIQVSDLELHWSETSTGLRLVVTNHKSKLPLESGLAYALDAEGNSLAQVKIERGLAEFTLSPELQEDVYFIEVQSAEDTLCICLYGSNGKNKDEHYERYPESIKIETQQKGANPKQMSYYLQVERKIYKRGEKVKLMGIIRQVDHEKQELCFAEEGKVFVVSMNRGQDVYPFQLDKQGCFELEIDSESLEEGLHHFQLGHSSQSIIIIEDKDDEEHELEFIASMKDRRFDLRLTAPAQSMSKYRHATASLKMERYYFNFNSEQFPMFRFGAQKEAQYIPAQFPSQSISKKVFMQGERDRISLDIPPKTERLITERYRATLKLELENGQVMERIFEGLIHPAKQYIGLCVQQRREIQDSDILKLQLVDCEGRELREDCRVEFQFISCLAQEASPELRHQVDLKKGKASLPIPQLPHRYFFARVEGYDAEGRLYQSEFPMLHVGHSRAYHLIGPSAPDKLRQYRAGEEICVPLEPLPAGQLQLMLEDRGLIIHHWSEPYDEQNCELRLTIPESTGHALALHILYLPHGNNTKNKAQAWLHPIQLKANEHELQVELEAAENYAAGEEVKISGRVLHAGGEAASKAQLLLWVIEEAAFTHGETEAGNPLAQMHLYSGKVNPWYGMLRDFKAKRPASFPQEELIHAWTEMLNFSDFGAGIGSGGGWFYQGPAPMKRHYTAPALLWEPRLACDSEGRFSASFKTPNNGKAYRIIAIACAGAEDFGKAEASFRIESK